MVVAEIRSSRLELGAGKTETFAPSSTAGINPSCGKALNVAGGPTYTTGRLPVDRCRPVWLQPVRGSTLHADRTLPGFLYTGAVPRCVVSRSKAGSGLNMRCRRTSRGETRRSSHTHTSSVRTCISRRPRADDA